MDNKIIILITICALVVSIVLGGLYFYIDSNNNSNNNINSTNITNNATVIEAEYYEEKTEISSDTPTRELKHVPDGDYKDPYYLERYPDGRIRQYDLDGNLIGSTFEEDQANLPHKL